MHRSAVLCTRVMAAEEKYVNVNGTSEDTAVHSVTYSVCSNDGVEQIDDAYAEGR